MSNMVRWNSVENARKTRIRVVDDGPFRGKIVYLIESEASQPEQLSAPQAFLAEQDPGWSFLPHFHLQDEFQVVVAGSGTLARTVLGPVTVHYAARETVYGPLIAGDAGLSYLTIRGITDSGIWPPADWKKVASRRGRPFQTHSQIIQISPPGNLHRYDRTQLINDLPDGSQCYLERIPAGAQSNASCSGRGNGLFVVLLSGAVEIGEVAMEGLCVAFISSQEMPKVIDAGSEGAVILLLQFG